MGLYFLKKWRITRHDIISLRFSVAFSALYVRLIFLDYGVNISFELPSFLDCLNPIHLITKGLFRIVLKLCKKRGDISFSKLQQLSNNKRLELEILPVREIVTFDYHWTAHSDHWGHWALLAIAGVELSAKFYDKRHWNYKLNMPEMTPMELDH